MNSARHFPRILLPALALAAGLVVPPGMAAQDPGSQEAARSGAALGVDLYRSFGARDGNVLFSPYSISEVLALLSAGSDGNTRRELLHALHWDAPPDRLAVAFGAQDLDLDRAAQDGSTLMVANGLWYQQLDAPRPEFLRIARVGYRAEVRTADFMGNAQAAELDINGWVGQKTAGKITELFPPGALNGRTRIVLANAIYFKGRWTHPFEARSTAPRPFFIAPGRTVMAPTMTGTEQLRAVSGPACDLLELPYGDGSLSMVILLPRSRSGLPLLEQQLTSAGLLEWLASLDLSMPERIEVALPRFKMSYSVDLAPALRQAGVTSAFVPLEADFSPLDGKRDLFVSAAFHKAFVDVNEEGTEAAGATGIAMSAFAVELSREFRVDHPFLFLIRDRMTGSLLFLGRVADPSPN